MTRPLRWVSDGCGSAVSGIGGGRSVPVEIDVVETVVLVLVTVKGFLRSLRKASMLEDDSPTQWFLCLWDPNWVVSSVSTVCETQSRCLSSATETAAKVFLYTQKHLVSQNRQYLIFSAIYTKSLKFWSDFFLIHPNLSILSTSLPLLLCNNAPPIPKGYKSHTTKE